MTAKASFTNTTERGMNILKTEGAPRTEGEKKREGRHCYSTSKGSRPRGSGKDSKKNGKRMKRNGSKKGDNHPRSRRVEFGEVEIFEFVPILGDHPDAFGGAPLTFGWKHFCHRTADVNTYEKIRGPRRRPKEYLVTSRAERETHLLLLGYKYDEILKISEEVIQAKKRRKTSFRNQKWDGFNITLESAKSSVMKVVPSGKNKYKVETNRRIPLSHKYQTVGLARSA